MPMFLFLFLSSLLFSHHLCAEVSVITPSQPLSQEQTLVSPSQIFELGFFSPNNSGNIKYVGIWHKNIFPRKPVWVANREKPIAASDTLASLTVSRNGNLELEDGNQKTVWSTNVSVASNGSAAALLLDNGNFVLKANKDAADQLWETFDHPTDTLLPTQLMGFDSISGKRNVLTSWRSESDPSTGMFSAGLTPDVPSQAVIWTNGSAPSWRTGPWDKSKFVGVPLMVDGYLSGYYLDDNVKQGTTYFSFNFVDKTNAYLDLSSDGIMKIMKSANGENWRLIWVAQKSSCDIYASCGPFGVCVVSESPTPNCKCLKGFVPKSNEEWSRGNRTGGCVRKTELSCESTNTSRSVTSRGKEDVFSKMVRLKLPDFHEYIPSSDHEDCMKWCLNNCSCLAYGFVNNIGCLVWSKDLIDIQEFPSDGVDLFIRLAHAESGGRKRIRLIASVTAVCFISILSVIVYCLLRLRANRKGSVKVRTTFFPLSDTTENSRDTLQEYIRNHDPSELCMYTFDIILIATNNFDITNKLGEGGFGPVYKGKLQDGTKIAVKRLSSSSGQGIEEFKNEMLLISKLQHKNLVRIMGCCVKDDEKLLIYEFMPNRSLDTILFNPTRRSELDWGRRLNIIQGVARGLLYLHHDSYLKVIHRDLKVSNILLDEKMNPKISDFGLSRIFQGTQTIANTQKVVGTLGYMSPEYAMGGIFSEKSDVYSFGVLLLEIISGRKCASFYDNEEHLGFLAYAWNLWNERRGLGLVDEVLADSYSLSEVMRCVHIGLLCVQDKAADRPTMPEIVLMLSSETVLPQPKEPIFTFQNSASESDPQPREYDNVFSANEATMTVIQGR